MLRSFEFATFYFWLIFWIILQWVLYNYHICIIIYNMRVPCTSWLSNEFMTCGGIAKLFCRFSCSMCVCCVLSHFTYTLLLSLQYLSLRIYTVHLILCSLCVFMTRELAAAHFNLVAARWWHFECVCVVVGL